MSTSEQATQLQRGAKGREVVQLQQQLMDFGYYTGLLDGDFGGGTERAVMAFQAAYGLEETGVVDESTWSALGLEAIIDAVGDSLGFEDGTMDHWPTADEFVALCLAQEGDEYEFGEKVDLDDPDPSVFDCAELVEWAVAQLGLIEHLGKTWDWSQGQRAAINKAGMGISVDEARGIAGALLFNSTHVAVSLGTGNETIEAMGEKWGVRRGTIDSRKTGASRFDGAGLIPGVVYPGM